MNNRKSQNSILVLATLGVYLGLVLVGATPQVLAQAAMTKQFSVKDEVGIGDKLDKKPEGDPDDDKLDLARALIDYARELGKLQSIGKYDPLIDRRFSKRTTFSLGRQSREMPPNEWLSLATDEFVWRLFNENFERVVDKSDAAGAERYLETSAQITVAFEDKDFRLDIELFKSAPVRAADLYISLDHLFRKRLIAATDPREKLIYEATRFSIDDKRVLLVTRLPRSGLDTQFAANAK